MDNTTIERGIMGISRLKFYHTIHDYLMKYPKLLETDGGTRLHDKIVDLLLAERRLLNNFEFENRQAEYDEILNGESKKMIAEYGDEIEKIGVFVDFILND